MATTGAEIASAYVALTVKAPGLKKDIGKELGSVDTSVYGSQMGSKLADGMKKTLKVAGAGVAAVLGTALVKGFGRLKAIETAQAKMRGLGHDSKTVAKAMDNALASVKGTAFGLGDAATVAGGAMAAQIKPGKELETHLKRIANNAAAAGVGFDEMGSIFNKAATQANGVQNDIIGQLADKGIPIYAELGKQMGVTAGEVFKLASEGKVSFEVFSKAAEAAAGTVAAEMGGTTTGAFDNMMAALGRFGAKLLEDVFPLIGPLFQSITKWLDESLVHIEPVIAAFGEKLASAIDGVKSGWQWLKDNSDWLGPTAAAATAAAGALGGYLFVTKTLVPGVKAAKVAVIGLNTAMKANVIGVIITAIAALVAGLVWFFTKTETGKKIWAEFTRFLGEAWANISGFFTAAYENVIKPVFDGIASVVSWVWETILQPIFQALGIAFAILGGIILGTYEALIKPVWDLFAAVVKWLWETIVRPVFAAMGTAFKAFGLIVQALWAKYVQPVFNFIGNLIRTVWASFVKPVFDAMSLVIRNTLGPVFTWLRDSVITPVWNTIKSVIAGVWNNGIKPVIDTMVKIVRSDPKRAFEAARDAIGKAWKGIQELAAKPVRFVVNTVINGLIGTINKIPGVNIPKVSLPQGFAHGGILPGTSRMSDGDDQLIMARRGEGMMVSEALRTSADRSAFLAANAAGRRGVGFASMLQGLARGGLVHPMPGAVMTTGWYGYPGHSAVDLAKPQGTPIQAAGAGTVSAQNYHGMYGNMVDIQHGGGLSTRYAHMLANVAVRLGQVVKAGQVIGYEGSTGNSTGPHLHYEVMIGGRQVNPIPYLNGGGVKPLFGVVDGLAEFATNTFKKAFPGGGMWIDAAGGIMSQGVKSVVGWATDLLSVGGDGLVPTLYDSGGWLQPGLSLVQNKTGAPEPILTSAQWDDMKSSRSADRGGLRAGERLTIVLDDGTELGGYVERRAGAVVDRKLAPVSASALASSHGRRV